MLMRLAVVFTAVICLAVLVAANVYFARQREALRQQWLKTVAAEPAEHRLHTGRHLVLDCVEIPPVQ